MVILYKGERGIGLNKANYGLHENGKYICVTEWRIKRKHTLADFW